MKITFILPAVGKKKGKKYLKSWTMEPLTIAVLNSLISNEVEKEFFDDRIEKINYETSTDLVFITVETYTAKRAYFIANEFRKRGKKVVLGGYHVTLMPEEAEKYADTIMCGNAENIINNLLDDFKNNSLKKRYVGNACIGYKLPDRSIYKNKMKKYLPVSLVETGRGCYHNCEFCSISAYYHSNYIHRPVEDIINEMKTCKNKLFFLVDDSIFSNKEFARELFTEIKKLNIIWATQITLDVAKNDDLLQLMKDSGCEMVLIGFESINEENLKQINKEWTKKLGEIDELIEKIHKVGISIYASFVFGFDSDNEESFKKTLEFSKKHEFFVVAFNHLLAFPNTQTYNRLKEENRLISDSWWLQDGYTFGTVSFTPKQISPEKLTECCKLYRKDYFSMKSIFKRGLTTFKRSKSFMMNVTYWFTNILFHFEIDQRFGLPIGENLEEENR